MNPKLIVTRHPALVDYLFAEGIVERGAPVLQHVTEEDVRGHHVVGVLPMHLAAHAASVTEVPMDIPAELRGKEMTLAQVREFARPPVTYVVRVGYDAFDRTRVALDEAKDEITRLACRIVTLLTEVGELRAELNSRGRREDDAKER